MIDRKNGPKIKDIVQITPPSYEVEHLEDGTALLVVDKGSQELTSIEIINLGGRHIEHKKGVSRATSRILKEGSKQWSSSYIAEEIDFYGASLATGANLDHSHIKLFSLSKHIKNVLPILHDIRYNAVFPQEELDRYIETSTSRLQIDLAKNDIVSYRAITEALFGTDAPYGYNSTEDIYSSLTRKDLLQNYEEAFSSSNQIIVLSGRATPATVDMVKELFCSSPKPCKAISYTSPDVPLNKKRHYISAEKSQTTIKIGRRLFSRRHKDYNGVFILNTILGGYFGSRLMSSIREKQGLTYNIYSHIDTMLYDGYFYISTDVSNENVDKTIEEIYKQIQILRTDLIDESELKMVRNYLTGNFFNLIDGPFKLSTLAKMVHLSHLPITYLQDMVEDVVSITPQELRALAVKYLDPDDMIEIIVGGD